MAIDFSNVEKVMYGAQEVVKIQQGTTTLWEKVVDPTANLLSLQAGIVTSATYDSGNLHAFGVYSNDLNACNAFKVHWSISAPTWVDSNGIVSFPYTTSRTGSTMAKMGVGSARANSSNNISSSSAQYGLTIKDAEDWSAYKHDRSGTTIYSGEFTVTPGSSSTYSNKCLSALVLENLYSGGTQVEGISIQFNRGSFWGAYFWMNNDWVTVSSGKAMKLSIMLPSLTYDIAVCVEPA